MAKDHLQIISIVIDYFRPYRFEEGRQFSAYRFLKFALVPVLLAIWMTREIGPVTETYRMLILTVFGIAATVLTALLAVIQNLVGAVDRRPYTEGEKILYRRQVVRLEVLRDLYACIAVTVMVLLLSLIPLLLLRLTSSDKTEVAQESLWVSALSFCVYIAGVYLAFSLFHIITGVYLVLDVHAKDVERELRDCSPDSFPNSNKTDISNSADSQSKQSED